MSHQRERRDVAAGASSHAAGPSSASRRGMESRPGGADGHGSGPLQTSTTSRRCEEADEQTLVSSAAAAAAAAAAQGTAPTSADIRDEDDDDDDDDDDEQPIGAEEDACLICLGSIVDRCVLPNCLHSLFCFACILKWIGIHRRCPLCSADIGPYLIHLIRSDSDYVRHHLPSLSANRKGKERGDDGGRADTDPLQLQAEAVQREARARFRSRISRPHSAGPTASHTLTQPATPVWGGADSADGPQERRDKAVVRWNTQLAKRRRIYRQSLYCLHVGSNRTTKLAPPPSSETVAATPVLQSTLLHFVRRELLAFPRPNIDVDFLSTYTLTLLKSLEVRSDEAVRLLGEFLGEQGGAHFCHELYTFLRFVSHGGGSGSTGMLRDRVLAFDQWAQYDWPEERLSRVAVARRQRRAEATRSAMQQPPTRAPPLPPPSKSKSKSKSNSSDQNQISSPQLDDSPPQSRSADRHEVIALRAQLLARLDEERARSSATHMSDSDAPHPGSPPSAAACVGTALGIDGAAAQEEAYQAPSAAARQRDERLTQMAQERLKALQGPCSHNLRGISGCPPQAKPVSLLDRLGAPPSPQSAKEDGATMPRDSSARCSGSGRRGRTRSFDARKRRRLGQNDGSADH